MHSLRQYALLWILFFLISAGLGYAALRRYDPRQTSSLSDTAAYYQLVIGDPRNLGRENMRGRVLVPFVAKPFYWIGKSYLKSIDPVFFGLLVANSMFCALTATILFGVAGRVVPDRTVALLAATLYLLSFAIPNFYLAGMVDSAEACLMIGLTWLMLTGKWRWLPLLGLIGALAKETFLPLGSVFAVGWLLATSYRGAINWKNTGWVGAFVLTTALALIVLHSMIAGHLTWPWQIAAHMYVGANFAAAFLKTFTAPGFWYFFVWLLPFGVWKLRSLPRPWLVATAVATIAALLMSAWKDVGANAARPVFSIVGPMLSLSVAILISRLPPAHSRTQ